MDNWQEVTLLEAKYFTQSGKFRCKEDLDPFAMEVQHFVFPGSEKKIEFNFKLRNSDPVKYYIYPMIDGKPVTIKELKEATGITEI